MSPPRLLSSTLEPKSQTRTSGPKLSAALWRIWAICSGLRRMAFNPPSGRRGRWRRSLPFDRKASPLCCRAPNWPAHGPGLGVNKSPNARLTAAFTRFNGDTLDVVHSPSSTLYKRFLSALRPQMAMPHATDSQSMAHSNALAKARHGFPPLRAGIKPTTLVASAAHCACLLRAAPITKQSLSAAPSSRHAQQSESPTTQNRAENPSVAGTVRLDHAANRGTVQVQCFGRL